MSSSTKQTQANDRPVESRRPADFKYVYSNVFGLGMSANELSLRFGLAENPSKPADATDQVGVILSLAGAKSLAFVLTEIINNFEIHNKMAIPFPDEKRNELKALLEASTVIHSAKK